MRCFGASPDAKLGSREVRKPIQSTLKDLHRTNRFHLFECRPHPATVARRTFTRSVQCPARGSPPAPGQCRGVRPEVRDQAPRLPVQGRDLPLQGVILRALLLDVPPQGFDLRGVPPLFRFVSDSKFGDLGRVGRVLAADRSRGQGPSWALGSAVGPARDLGDSWG